jgi:hypothetical protein
MVTLDQLKEMAWKESICVAIDFAQKNYGNRPTRPSKPIMPKNPKAEQAFEFAKLLKEWEEEMEAYDIVLDGYNEHRNKIDALIVELIKEQAGIEVVPEQYRDKVYAKAWEYGHSYGFYEVWLKLSSLVEIFE